MEDPTLRPPGRLKAAALIGLLVAGALPAPWALAAAGPQPLALDFSGDGNVTDQGAFGVYGASVEVTLWSSSGIAAGPLSLSAGPGGAYNWSFPQAPQTSLLNLTFVAQLPWDPSVSVRSVFDVSNGTPRTLYAGVRLALPFPAIEDLSLASPSADVVLARGTQVTAAIFFANGGNVSIAHVGFGLSTSSTNLTIAALDADPAIREERPGSTFGYNASFSAPAAAGIEDLAATFSVLSTSGANFSFGVTVHITPARNARVTDVATVPSPPNEGQPAQILVTVDNTGSDAAPSTDVRVIVFNATVANLYGNASRYDLAPNATITAVFDWTPVWSPGPVTIDASVAAAQDFNISDDARSVTLSINSTNLPPSVNISSPAQGARLSGNVTVAGTAVDPEGGGLALSFSVDGAPPFLTGTGPSFGFVWDLSVLPDGPHSLSVTATDNRGQRSVANVTVLVLNRGPNTPPTVTLTTPRDGDTVGASVAIAGSAADERGELASVWVSIDGAAEAAANGTAAWNDTWAPASDGPHLLRIRSFDGIEFSAPAFANVTANLTPPTSIIFSGVQVAPASAIPGENITVTGNVGFDSSVLAAGASVSAQVQGTASSATTAADGRGVFTLQMTAPPAVGSYTILLAAIAGGAQGNATSSLTVSTSSLPDLSLIAGSFSVSPDPPPPNTPIHHTITVQNTGSVAATATLRVWDGPRSSATLIFESRFTVTTSRPAGFDHTYLPGTHNLTMALEEVTPQDANLADNTLVVSVPVLDAPDFAIISIAPSTSAIAAGSTISFLVIVANNATTLGSTKIEMWDGPPLAPGSVLFYQEEHVTIAGGARERVVATWTPTAGTHTIFAKAVLAVPDELVLTNNELNLTLTVPGEPTAPTPGFLPGFGAFGAVGAAVGGAAALRRKREKRPRGPRSTAPAALGMLLLLGLVAAFVPPPVESSFSDASNVPGPLNGVCQTCHSDPNGGGPLNPFGADYQAERNASGGSVNWTRLGAKDSDHDGYSNSDELNGSYLPGDAGSNPATGVRYRYGGSGVSTLLTGLLAVLAVSAMGVWLGVSSLKRRNARKAAEEENAKGAEPPAPKP